MKLYRARGVDGEMYGGDLYPLEELERKIAEDIQRGDLVPRDAEDIEVEEVTEVTTDVIVKVQVDLNVY